MFKKIKNQISWKICFDLALCLLLLSAVLFFATGAFCADEKAEPTEVLADMGTGIQTEPPIIHASNTLCEDTVYSYCPPEQASVFGSELVRCQIKTITFVDTLAEAGENAWDVSAAKDNSVLAWTEKNGELYDLFIGAEGGMMAPDNCRELFDGYLNVTQIVFNGIFDTSSVADMSAMFRRCNSLAQLDLSAFDTSSVTKMSEMFEGCESLEQLDLSGFDTSSVTDMSYMFCSCTSLEQLDLSGFDTPSVTDMSHMFYYCESLKQLDLSGFTFPSETGRFAMFRYCESLDLTGVGASFAEDLSKESFQLPEKWEYRFPEPLLGSFQSYGDDDADIIDMADGEFFGYWDRLTRGCSSWCGCQDFECQVEASSTLAPQGNVSYDACHLAEETRNSVWSEGVEGDGIGEIISIKQRYAGGGVDKFTFTSICIVNGYAQDEAKWQRNGRVKSLKLYYAGEYMGLIELKDTMEPQYIDVTSAQMKIGNGFTAEFSFEIAEVYKGTKYADTCLTGILIDFDGRRAH